MQIHHRREGIQLQRAILHVLQSTVSLFFYFRLPKEKHTNIKLRLLLCFMKVELHLSDYDEFNNYKNLITS